MYNVLYVYFFIISYLYNYIHNYVGQPHAQEYSLLLQSHPQNSLTNTVISIMIEVCNKSMYNYYVFVHNISDEIYSWLLFGNSVGKEM